MSQTHRLKDLDEHDRRKSERDLAAGQAAEAGANAAPAAAHPGFFERFARPGLSAPADADGLEQKLSAELSHHHLVANIDSDERDRLQLLNQALSMQVKAEHPPKAGPASKCVGAYRQMMFGDDRSVLSDAKARSVDSALGEEGVRSMMQSGAVNGRVFDGFTKIQSVAIAEGADGGGSKGAVGRAKDFLFGSDS
jgi:hypothetical protein